MGSRFFTTLLIIFTVFIILPLTGFAASTTEDMKQANDLVIQTIQLTDRGEMDAASEQFKKFSSTWITIEDGVKKKSPQAYHDIEDKMGQVQFTFAQQPINQEKVKTALLDLKKTNENVIEGKLAPSPNKSSYRSGQQGDIAGLVALLNQSLVKIKNNDIEGAKADIEKFRESWLNVEGVVLTQSSKIYSDAERDMVSAYAKLSAKPADLAGATTTIENMRDYLSPLVSKTSYNMMDAITILLREGLEALLVVVALLGFIKKAGHEKKSKWIWFGVGAGIGVSIILGIIVNMLFSAGTFGNNNFLISGWTGIFAAVMLLYMSYWLHSKSSISEWQKYIHTKSTKALASGSLISLALLSFLAVFREGTETVLFFIGMASSIKLTSLLAGIAIGLFILVALSYLILKVGLKIPMRPFFLLSSILMFYLCIKFTGMGIHGLQLAGLLPATQAPIPTIDFFALYSTWESFIPQIILLIVAVVAALINNWKDRKFREKSGGNVNEIA